MALISHGALLLPLQLSRLWLTLCKIHSRRSIETKRAICRSHDFIALFLKSDYSARDGVLSAVSDLKRKVLRSLDFLMGLHALVQTHQVYVRSVGNSQKWLKLVTLFGLLLSFGGSSYTHAKPNAHTSQVRTLRAELTHSVTLHYLLQVPAQYQNHPHQRWPLLLFLHGGSVRGSDIELVKRYGPPVFAREKGDFPFVLVSPQCPQGEIWTDTEALMALISSIQRSFRIDPTRIYVTGISMGGRGALYLAYKNPSRFAGVLALAPLSSIPTWAGGFGKTAIRIIHGDMDTSAPIADSKQLVDEMHRANKFVDFVVLPGRDHFIADLYRNSETYEWLLKQHR